MEFYPYLWKPKGKEFFHSLVDNVVSESNGLQGIRCFKKQIIWWNLKQRSDIFPLAGSEIDMLISTKNILDAFETNTLLFNRDTLNFSS